MQKCLQLGDHQANLSQLLSLAESEVIAVAMMGVRALAKLSDPNQQNSAGYENQFDSCIKQIVDFAADPKRKPEFVNYALETLSNLGLRNSLAS